MFLTFAGFKWGNLLIFVLIIDPCGSPASQTLNFLLPSRYACAGGCPGKAAHPLGRQGQPAARGWPDGVRHPVREDGERAAGDVCLPAVPARHQGFVGGRGYPERLRPSPGVSAGKWRRRTAPPLHLVARTVVALVIKRKLKVDFLITLPPSQPLTCRCRQFLSTRHTSFFFFLPADHLVSLSLPSIVYYNSETPSCGCHVTSWTTGSRGNISLKCVHACTRALTQPVGVS